MPIISEAVRDAARAAMRAPIPAPKAKSQADWWKSDLLGDGKQSAAMAHFARYKLFDPTKPGHLLPDKDLAPLREQLQRKKQDILVAYDKEGRIVGVLDNFYPNSILFVCKAAEKDRYGNVTLPRVTVDTDKNEVTFHDAVRIKSIAWGTDKSGKGNVMPLRVPSDPRVYGTQCMNIAGHSDGMDLTLRHTDMRRLSEIRVTRSGPCHVRGLDTCRNMGFQVDDHGRLESCVHKLYTGRKLFDAAKVEDNGDTRNIISVPNSVMVSVSANAEVFRPKKGTHGVEFLIQGSVPGKGGLLPRSVFVGQEQSSCSPPHRTTQEALHAASNAAGADEIRMSGRGR